jgi:hypothetical protein
MTTTYRLGPVAKQVLKAISEEPNGLSTDAVGSFGFYDDPRGHVAALESLSTAGMITFMSTLKVWRITRPGSSLLSRTAINKQPDYIGVNAEPRRMSPVGVYTCPELTRNPPRPGSADAYQLPSMFSGRQVARVSMLMSMQGVSK